ncbi:PAS domain-containing protein [Vibrio sinaloensis]|nr:PAS domain-containing protein [Vibrio sinaloensis]
MKGYQKQQLLSALNAAQTALMMIDRDFNITYINRKSIELLQQHEALFRSVWPNFQANEEFLLGYCIDAFHVNPSHQRQMLSNPANLPYTTNITVKDVKKSSSMLAQLSMPAGSTLVTR